MSQDRDFPLCLPSPLASRRRRCPVWLQFFRSGTCVQAVLSTSSISTSMFRPLRSTVVTRFSATMSPSDSPRNRSHVIYSLWPFLLLGGLPGSSTDLSTRAAPFHPEQPGHCTYPLLRRRFWLHLIRQTGHCYLCNEADSGSRFITAARVFASQGFASRITSALACSATCPTGN